MNIATLSTLFLLALALRAPGERQYEDLWIATDLYAYVGVGAGPEEGWRFIYRVKGVLTTTSLHLERYLYLESSPPVVEKELFWFSGRWGAEFVEALTDCREASRKSIAFERELKHPDLLIRMNPKERKVDLFLGEREDGTRLRVAQISVEGAGELAEAITKSSEFEKIINDSLEKKMPNKPGAGQPATQPADKDPPKDQPSTPTSEDAPR